MGLYFNYRSASVGAVANQHLARAVMTMPILTLAADGILPEAELERLLDICVDEPIFRLTGLTQTRILAEDIVDSLQYTRASRVFADAVRDLTTAEAEIALTLSIRVLLDYGQPDASQRAFLMAMGQGLGLDLARANALYVQAVEQQRQFAA